MADLHIENYDFTIIDFNELLINDIQPEIINSLHEFNLLEKSINNLQVKKFIYHYTIYNICFLRRVDRLLPLKIFISKYSIVYLDHLIGINDGKAQTTINSMVSKINNMDISKYTFSGVKKFTKRYELTFLNKDYFNRLSTKLLLIR